MKNRILVDTDPGQDDALAIFLALSAGMEIEVLARAEQAIGAPVDRVVFSGGLAGNPALCQMKADVLARTVFIPKTRETGLAGAAMIPRMANGESVAQLPDDYLIYTPRSERLRYHEERFSVFRHATTAVREISHQLSRS